MNPNLAQQAIRAAVEGNWQHAAQLNRTILQENPADIEAMLRLANALTQLGKTKEAASIYEKVLKLDHYNTFAQRALLKLKKMKRGKKRVTPELHGLETMFLEEPGKTKTVGLVHTAPPAVLAHLDAGQRVLLVPRRHRISVTTEEGVYVGRLPDDLSVRLLGFISGGNKYEAVAKGVNTTEVKVFIQETYRCPKFEKTPSFFHEGNNSAGEQL